MKTPCDFFRGALGVTTHLSTTFPTTHLQTLFKHAHQEWVRAGSPPLRVLKKEVAAEAGSDIAILYTGFDADETKRVNSTESGMNSA